MSLPLAYRPEVRSDIDEAYDWYERKQNGLGERFLAALRKSLDWIHRGPEMYALLYRDVRAAPLWRFPYVIYYRIESSCIRMIAVQHGGQDAQTWQARADQYPPTDGDQQ